MGIQNYDDKQKGDGLVISLREVVDNIKQFNQDLTDNTEIVSQLTQFKHGYYIPSLDAFGPSKYIGYKNMNTSRYDRGKRKTGVDTEKILKEWFTSCQWSLQRAKN